MPDGSAVGPDSLFLEVGIAVGKAVNTPVADFEVGFVEATMIDGFLLGNLVGERRGDEG